MRWASAWAAAIVLGSHPMHPIAAQVSARSAGVVEEVGRSFRDTNRNGSLEPFEDWRLSASERAADLVGRMTLAEKAGAMMMMFAPATEGAHPPTYDTDAITALIRDQHITAFASGLVADPVSLAAQHNALQDMAGQTRLGIPLTLSTDPRHHFQSEPLYTNPTPGFSQWPEPLGFAALGDAEVTRRFADIARQEYRAVGFTMGLSPQADLATEPRWPRITATFGEDPELAREHVREYVAGFQGGESGLSPEGVAMVVKHWAGYGAAVEGFDAHNFYGRFARTDGAFESHLTPFEGAFEVHVAGVMPTYGILTDVELDGVRVQQVGGGFNRPLLDLLRGRFGYDGAILSDFAITRDCEENCRIAGRPHGVGDIGMPWGMLDASVEDRYVRGVEAGLDQFGGAGGTASIVQAVDSGRLSEDRLDASVTRVMELKFTLGLFENPFVDEALVPSVVGAPAFVEAALSAQSRALVVLENDDGILPLGEGARVYLEGIDSAKARSMGLAPVALEDAEVAVIRTEAPHERLHPNFFFGRTQNEGRLDFRTGDEALQRIQRASARVPTIVVVFLDRPAVRTTLRALSAGLIGEFGASDEALLRGLVGRVPPEGRLPFALPRDMRQVEAQSSGRPHDMPDPLYPFGHGLQLSLRPR